MPKRKAAIVARANNLPNLAFTLAKKVIERLSPQNKAKRAVNIQPKTTNEAPLTHHSRFMDAYQRGLNGRQAAWAAKRYRGHRVLPESIMRELEDAGIY
ncbi:hypothetical protein H0H92_000290 [Tricholoma furcatifolium]|nr:hypothetical protein H0H92_000290 [Tricholoma furcatifolium]